MSAPAHQIVSLEPGLYLVATPIGTARDITLRALDILASADVLAAEDTRTLRRLMEIHGIPLSGRRILSYHDHNGAKMRPRIAELIAEGNAVAYTSDAGTPLVADPGYALAREIGASGHMVTTAPGVSAALAALSLSGLPSDRFLFAGFLPSAEGPRRTALKEISAAPATLILFESSQRCSRTVRACVVELGDRQAALCRELTKRFEEVRRGSLSEIADGIEADPPRGEIVLVIDRDRSDPGEDDMEGALRTALETMSVKDAAQVVSEALGAPRRSVYQMALKLEKDA